MRVTTNDDYCLHRDVPRLRPSRGFVIAPMYNRVGKSDGAYCTSLARQFAVHHRFEPPLIYDNDGDDDAEHLDDGENPRLRVRQIFDALDAMESGIDTFAYFGHGNLRSLPSAGMGPIRIQSLCRRLAEKSAGRLTVILYACLCGGSGGVAETMQRELRQLGIDVMVMGHTTSGDAVKNPFKRRFGDGAYIVEPQSELWRPWIEALSTTDLWKRVPWMSGAEIDAELRGSVRTAPVPRAVPAMPSSLTSSTRPGPISQSIARGLNYR